MSRAGLVDYYLNKSTEPDFEIDSIRKELTGKGVDEEEIRIITYLVDSEIQRNMLTRESQKQINTTFWIGLVIVLIGIPVFILSGGTMVLLATTLGGGGLMAYSRRN